MNTNMVMYIILIVIVLFALYMETRDNNCKTLFGPWNSKECTGEGMPWSGTKPHEDDSCSTLLNKVDRAGTSIGRFILWRRSLITAFLCTLIVYALIIRVFPVWQQFYITVIGMYAIIYFIGEYYNYHIYNRFEENVTKGSDILREKCNL